MEPTPENMKHLANFLGQTLQPDPAVRKQAEHQLSAAKLQPGYAGLLLHLVVQADFPAEIRLQGAIQFKNLINQHWEANEHSDFQLPEADKVVVKRAIVGAMMAVPEKLQIFVSDALGTISNADFPLDQKWPELMPQLMQSLASQDPSIVIATLRTTHAITRKYRTASQTEVLWNEILFMLKQTHDRLLSTHTSCIALAQQSAGNKPILELLFQTLEIVAKIFYDLNFQDIPEVRVETCLCH
jgi:exportin-2 (importin alpha re-exporter)